MYGALFGFVKNMKNYKILSNIKGPNDLKDLTKNELEILSAEIRKKIIEVVSSNGGHLASNLGVVELTVALHKAFNSPNDKIIWDVGHQCYAHKLLTGRFDKFDTLRKEGGISGFTKPNESNHDPFISGHASISLSAACGIARAELLKGTNNAVIAVIGDGALTGGIAYEGLNNAVGLSNLIIVLNCNEMSISKTVGSFARHVSTMRSNQTYISTRMAVKGTLDKIPIFGKLVKNTIHNGKKKVKKILYKSDFFTELGFSFLSPVDGHNVTELTQALNWAKQTDKPALIQVFTKKGQGYFKAVENPGLYHGVAPFDIKNGIEFINTSECFSDVFGKELTKLAEKDDNICAISAAMEHATGLIYFKSKFPDRFFDVGIAEQHAVTYASGMSSNGLLPVFAVYSTFLQRGYDQILHDAAIQNEHILLAVDRAGIVGEDGETHQGVFDTAYLSSIPNITIFSPCNYKELRGMLRRALYYTDGVVALRYPRGSEYDKLSSYDDSYKDYRIIGDCDKIIVTYGRLLGEALKAQISLLQKGIKVAVMKIGKIYPISNELLNDLKNYREVYFFEESIKSGGIGEHIASKLLELGFKGKWSLSAIDNKFIPQSTVNSALESLGLNSCGMENKVLANQINKKHMLAERG